MTEKKKVRRVIFQKPFNYAPKPNLPTTAYKSSDRPQTVNEDCFERATNGGFAIEAPAKVSRPRKKKTEE